MRHSFSISRSTPPVSPPGSSSSFAQRSSRVTLWCWTIFPATRSPPSEPPFAPRGARLLFLPPYSPDLNPIEQVFAKLKHLLRKADERTKEATWRRIGSLLDAFTPQECKNYLANAGYASI